MNRLIRAQRLWLVRRLLLLGGSAGAAAAAFALQLIRLRLDPNGAYVHAVALFVTFIILAILVRLVRLHLEGPGLAAPSWDRHAHRASVRESPLVAVCGVIVAALLVAVTPRLVAEERPGLPATLAVRFPEVVPAAAPVPAPAPDVVARPSPAIVEVKPVKIDLQPDLAPAIASSPEPARRKPTLPEPLPPILPTVEISYQQSYVDGVQEKVQEEPYDPRLPGEPIVPSLAAQASLPPIHTGFGGFLAMPSGKVNLEGGTGRFSLGIDDVRGSSTFAGAVDFTAEFALTPDSAVKIVYGGMRIFEDGELEEDTSFGSVTGLKGDPFKFEMTWSHFYAGLSHRITGYTRGSWFDLSVHAGAMIDHTLSRFESGASGVKGEPADGERGWFAPGAGISMTFRGPGPAGFILEILQSVPANLGGQAIALTDIRTGVTVDLSATASLFLGYRHVQAGYTTFQTSFAREDPLKSAELVIRGPILGLDLRF
ncbi:MAG TPA: hypothetical protein VK661_00575 [Planctomycetota bacterium]|nr:hypothetical protein [Planctomycetota bacterium]